MLLKARGLVIMTHCVLWLLKYL